jgi:hypothetical protein
MVVPRHDYPKPGMSQLVAAPRNVQSWRTVAAAPLQHRRDIRSARHAPNPRDPLGRQRPPCFEGSCTARRLRPFFLRRLSTARPQRVCIRARNPCFAVRRRLRGLYVGFIGERPFLAARNLAIRSAQGQG